MLSPFFRMYGHSLIKKHNKNTGDYLKLLPTTTLPESQWGAVSAPEVPVVESAKKAEAQLVQIDLKPAMPTRNQVEELVPAGGMHTRAVGAV